MKKHRSLTADATWYKDAIIYELHVKSFLDSSGDGIGDFNGLTSKLEYLRDLGVTAIWLLPFYPSPLKDDGYDMSDYFNIHPDYGTMKDFKGFLARAHELGMRVITELVLNHTSRDHIWFQRARRAKKGSILRDFYVWSDTPDKYKDARVIFKDFETSNWTWDPVANAYYWHRFYSHQPDLNFDNPYLQKAMMKVVDYWFTMGIDGLRLDAVPYLFEREGTNCENLPETHEFLKKLRAHIDSNFKDKMLLAEANQWPEDAAVYFGEGDECHMAFHFPLMPRMFMAVQMEDSFPIMDIMRVTPATPQGCQWAVFLRNHDELTLEMVTDEERDYMYRTYAQDPKSKINLGIRRRLAPLLGNNRRKIELLNILLFSLPGTPVIYYGDELGMGDNYYLGDRNGVRTPMQWAPDRNAGFSKASPQKLYLPAIIEPEYNYEAVNVENQDKNLSSLLWWMKRVITMRKKYKAFSRGDIELVCSDNHKVLAFVRKNEEENILVVANLSRFTQVVSLDIPQFEGFIPQEVFSGNDFPVAGKAPYTLMLGPHGHYWLKLRRRENPGSLLLERQVNAGAMEIKHGIPLDNILKRSLEEILPQYVRECKWFGDPSRYIRTVKIVEDAVCPKEGQYFHILLLEFTYTNGVPEKYSLPIGMKPKEEASEISEKSSKAMIARVNVGTDAEAFIFDGMYDDDFCAWLLEAVAAGKRIKGRNGVFAFKPSKMLKKLFADDREKFISKISREEQSNTSVFYGRKGIIKLYRRVDGGINPETEILKGLSLSGKSGHVPPFLGSIEYLKPGAPPDTISLVQGFVENTSDAWAYFMEASRDSFVKLLSKKEIAPPSGGSLNLSEGVSISKVPKYAIDVIGILQIELIALLGRRTAEMHLSLANIRGGGDFAPEPFSLLYQKAICKSMQIGVSRVMHLVRRHIEKMPVRYRDNMNGIISMEGKILETMKNITLRKIHTSKIRIHGDYHLGQMLFTGKDFVAIDFEGDPSKMLSERGLKRSPLRDVACMIRSLHYAAYSSVLSDATLSKEDLARVEPWVKIWYNYASGVFLHEYLSIVCGTELVPSERADIGLLVKTFLLERAVFELGEEFKHRPNWVIVPIKGIEDLCSIQQGG